MQFNTRRCCTVTALGLFIVGQCECYAQSSSSNSAAIPSATNDVKAGDWIYWRANRNILTEVPTSSGASLSLPATADSPVDQAAAANALQAAAEAAIKQAAVAAGKPDATQEDKDALQGALDAANQATEDAKKAAIANAKPSITATTVSAAQKLIETASSAAAKALDDAETADQKMLADQIALSKSKAPSQALKDKAKQSADTAVAMRKKKLQALAYLNAATGAYDTVLSGVAKVTVQKYCAPSSSRFLVTNIFSGTSTTASPSPSKSQVINTNSSTTPAPSPKTVQGIYPSHSNPVHLYVRAIDQYAPPSQKPDQSYYQSISPCSEKSSEIAHYDTLYEFPYDGEIAANDYEREGWTWGPMLIPYKFYLKDRTFKGNPSTVAYVGYEGWFPGISLATVLALGPALAQSSTASPTTTPPTNKPTTTSTVVTYTAATGLVASFGGSVKAGILVGKDWQGKGSGFQYEGHTWLALSIGTGF